MWKVYIFAWFSLPFIPQCPAEYPAHGIHFIYYLLNEYTKHVKQIAPDKRLISTKVDITQVADEKLLCRG